MGEFLRILLDSIGYLWPFRFVHEWERGVYYLFGRSRFVCRPGRLYMIVPFFCDVKVMTVVRDTLVTPLQTITCKDGGTLTFKASAQIVIEDAQKAYNNVAMYHETAGEDIAAILAEKLAEVDTDRFAAEGRGRLLASCRQALKEPLAIYGVKIEALRFNDFIRNIRSYRLFGETLIH